uniref:HAT C-terminal dimerisation domain-containing protein n=1 Tax=Knipowitschia caucasica TaxID=637954 RepID=A0AAV2KYQ8_KNICA
MCSSEKPQENEISAVDCEDLLNVRVLLLGQNRIRSTGGLRGARNLLRLDLSHNRLTRTEVLAVSSSVALCPFIREVCVEGNPLLQEPDWSSAVEAEQVSTATASGYGNAVVAARASIITDTVTDPKGNLEVEDDNQVDQALTALHSRFKQLQEFGNLFGFLFYLSKLREVEDIDLRRQCATLSDALNVSESQQDLNALDLFVELRILREMIPKGATTALKTLRYLKSIEGTFPNCEIALRVLLTIPVTVASGERSFSKLKLIKNYLRTSMSQDRLCGLALLSIEKEIASKLDYKDLIAEFAAKKARKVTL